MSVYKDGAYFFWQKKYIETKLKLKQFQSLGNYLNATCFSS